MELSVESSERGAKATVRLRGKLTRDTVVPLHRCLRRLARKPELQRVELDLAEVELLDSAGAIVARMVGPDVLGRHQKECSLVNVTADHQAALDILPDRLPARGRIEQLTTLEAVGAWGFATTRALAEIARLWIRGLRGVGAWMTARSKPRLGATVEQAVFVGVDAVFIVTLLGALVGVILAFQSAYQLQKFGAQVYMAEIVGLGMVREFGAVITAIILAGRSGAAMAAELGTMSVEEEIDALRSMGIDPVRFLVIPRVLAIVAMHPLLTLVATVVGIGAGILTSEVVDVPPAAVYERILDALRPSDFWLALLKSVLFGLLIGLVGCFFGLRTRGGAHNVGTSTTKAVVTSIILIVVTDSVVTTLWTLDHA